MIINPFCLSNKKVKNDTYLAIPVAGAINMITYGIPILIIDYFFKIISI